jgi:hypothetical protein
MAEKPLYKPFKSTKAGKKFSVYVKSASGGKRLIHFGASGWMTGVVAPQLKNSVNHIGREHLDKKRKMVRRLLKIKIQQHTGAIITYGKFKLW